MHRIIALLRETWWLWLGFYALNWYLIEKLDPMMKVGYPLITVCLIYFAFVRFDAFGNPISPDPRENKPEDN